MPACVEGNRRELLWPGIVVSQSARQQGVMSAPSGRPHHSNDWATASNRFAADWIGGIESWIAFRSIEVSGPKGSLAQTEHDPGSTAASSATIRAKSIRAGWTALNSTTTVLASRSPRHRTLLDKRATAGVARTRQLQRTSPARGTPRQMGAPPRATDVPRLAQPAWSYVSVIRGGSANAEAIPTSVGLTRHRRPRSEAS
jgi:hypothetical protein